MAEELLVNIVGDASKLKGALDNASGHVSSFSEKLGKIGKVATVGGLAISAAFTKTFLDFTAYETKLIDMAKVTDEPFDKIEAKLKTIDPVLGISKDLLSSYYQVISAGVKDPVEALDTLTVSLQAGKAAHTATSEVVKGITKMMAGYEGAIESASEAADLLFAIEKEGQTCVAELIPVIGGLAKTSFDLNIEQEAMAASMAVISKTAGSTAEAATQYEAVLTGLMKPTTDMIEAIEDMGYATAEQAIEEEGLVEVLKHLEEYMDRTGVSAAKLFGRKEAMLGFSALGAEGFRVLDETIVSVGEGMGGAQKAFDEWSKSGAASIDEIKNTFLNFSADVGKQLAPMIKEILGSITGVITRVKEWAEENPKLFETIVKVAAVIGGLAAVGGPILMAVAAFSAVAPAIALIGTIATGPIGLLIIAVTAIIAIWKNWDKIVEFVSGFVDKIMSYLEELKTIAIQKVTEMIDWIIEKFEDLANLPKKMMEWGKNALSGFSEGIKSKVGDLGEACKSAGNKIKNFFGFESPPREGPLSKSDQWMPNMMSMFGKGITDNIPKVIIPIETMTDKIESIFETTVANVIDSIASLTSTIQSELSNALYNVLSGTQTFGEAWGSMWKNIANAVLKQISDVISQIIFAAASQFLLALGPIGWVILLGGAVAIWAWINAQSKAIGGEIENIASSVKKFQMGGGTDTALAWFTPGEYVIAKPMTDFIKRSKMIPQNLIDAIATGSPTPIPAFANGGEVGYGGGGIFFAKGSIDIHDNKISDDVDIKRLAATVSNEILRKINLNRRH